jgi:phospholipase C
VMMENRSFDHYLGALRLDRAYPGAALVDGLRGDESNPDPDGAQVPVYRMTERSVPTPPHQWEPARAQFDGGRNDGFVRAHAGPHQHHVMGYYDRELLPLYYALADQFTVCDRWFSSVMGPTWPNRFYLHAATSQGVRTNAPLGFGGPPTIWQRLRQRCLPCTNYAAGGAPWYLAAFAAQTLGGDDAAVQADIEDFFRDARLGTLPSFALIEPDFLLNDDRPPHDVTLGQACVSSTCSSSPTTSTAASTTTSPRRLPWTRSRASSSSASACRRSSSGPPCGAGTSARSRSSTSPWRRPSRRASACAASGRAWTRRGTSGRASTRSWRGGRGRRRGGCRP